MCIMYMYIGVRKTRCSYYYSYSAIIIIDHNDVIIIQLSIMGRLSLYFLSHTCQILLELVQLLM